MTDATIEKLERLAYGPEEAAKALGVGRTHIFDLMRRGAIVSVKSGRRRLIPASALHAYLEQATGGDAA